MLHFEFEAELDCFLFPTGLYALMFVYCISKNFIVHIHTHFFSYDCTESQEKSRYTGSSRMPDSLQHTTDKSPQQLIDAKSERELNLLEHTDDPCCETRGLHYPKIPSVHFRSPSIPPWNSKEENGGSIRAVKKSWTDEKDPCFRNHPELLVDCNVFSPDSCGSFV